MKTFSEKVRAARMELGYTQPQLAQEAGLSVQSILGYEKGRRVPRISTVSRLAEALRVSTRYLIDDNCHDPLMDIENDSFFLRAREEFLKRVQESAC